MSLLIPQRAGTLKKGGYIQIKGHPCKIANMSTSKTGKHGHAKLNITAIDVLTKKKYEDLCPTSHNVMVPEIRRDELQCISADDEWISLMDPEGNVSEIQAPDDEELLQKIMDGMAGGEQDVLVTVLGAPTGDDPATAELNLLVTDVRLTNQA